MEESASLDVMVSEDGEFCLIAKPSADQAHMSDQEISKIIDIQTADIGTIYTTIGTAKGQQVAIDMIAHGYKRVIAIETEKRFIELEPIIGQAINKMTVNFNFEDSTITISDEENAASPKRPNAKPTFIQIIFQSFISFITFRASLEMSWIWFIILMIISWLLGVSLETIFKLEAQSVQNILGIIAALIGMPPVIVAHFRPYFK